MNRKKYIVLTITIALLVISVFASKIYITKSKANAENRTEEILSQLRPEIKELKSEGEDALEAIKIENESYGGYLTFPTLELQLPVSTNGSGVSLSIAPTFRNEERTIIVGSSSESQFAPLYTIQTAAPVLFTDTVGTVTLYTVNSIYKSSENIDTLTTKTGELLLIIPGNTNYIIKCTSR